jgi:hypothetical protein
MPRGAIAAAATGAAILVVSSGAAAPAAGPAKPTVLATGDSMIQYVDVYLKRRLRGRARVPSDAKISTGLSKPSLLNWPRYAGGQSGRFHPRAVVVFLGANDGFPISGRKCCGRGWRKAYARRAGKMMDAYVRGGARRVYWLALPQAREGDFRRIYPAVNKAARLAARHRRKRVRIVALNEYFTPKGRYRDVLRYHGRNVRVRQRDGIHLAPAGASIAARIVARRIRRDRVLR